MTASEVSRLLGAWTELAPRLPDALAAALAELIDAGLIPAGMGLPSQRELAAALGASRETVSLAVGSLTASGHLSTVRGSGARVRSGRVRAHRHGDGRMFSFTNAPDAVIDLSTGALPASAVARDELTGSPPAFEDYLGTDGYFPAGVPVLRRALADLLTQDGIPTRPQQILVTAGAQQATTLVLRSLLDPGDLALVEDPTYRGALNALRGLGARLEVVPVRAPESGGTGRGGGVDVELASRALARGPRLFYCQTSIHNPTGRSLPATERRRLGAAISRHGVVTIEDCCSYDLTRTGTTGPTLTGLVDEDLLISLGTLSKIFWGGLRIGWVRASEQRIRSLVEARASEGLATSIADQLLAVRLLHRSAEARRERRVALEEGLAATTSVLEELFPAWRWARIDGGTGLWVDTGGDAVALAERAKKAGVWLASGPGFSAHDGQRSMLRLPVWHEPAELERGLAPLL